MFNNLKTNISVIKCGDKRQLKKMFAVNIKLLAIAFDWFLHWLLPSKDKRKCVC